MFIKYLNTLSVMKRLFKIKYPKLLLIAAFTLISYFTFTNADVSFFISNLGKLSYLGMFIAGILFSLGFSTPFAVGFFVTAEPANIFISSIIGGAGALISDMLIFKFIRLSFMEEFKRLKRTKAIREAHSLISNNISRKISNYLLFIFAGIVIASPLPNEVGVSMLAGMTKINPRLLGIVSFIMNTLGIYILLSI